MNRRERTYTRRDLFDATQYGHGQWVRCILVHFPEWVNVQEDTWPEPTPLHRASQWNQCKIAKFLIQRGANVQATDARGDTPLHTASAAGHLPMVQLLVQQQRHGPTATVPHRNHDGWTPLHVAVRYGHLAIVQFLVEHGHAANPNCIPKDAGGSATTPLHLAVERGHLGIVQFLTMGRRRRRHDAATAAAAAAELWHWTDRDGRTPLQRARAKGLRSMVQLWELVGGRPVVVAAVWPHALARLETDGKCSTVYGLLQGRPGEWTPQPQQPAPTRGGDLMMK